MTHLAPGLAIEFELNAYHLKHLKSPLSSLPLLKGPFAMPRRQFCTCCGKLVTETQLREHTKETARRQAIISLGGNPTPPATTRLSGMAPITGNDIFEPRLKSPDTSLAIDGDPSDGNLHKNSLPPTSSPHFTLPCFVEDEDFPPNPTEDMPRSPQGPTPTNEYPSLHDPEDSEKEGDENEPDLEKFLDWEYIKQSRPPVFVQFYQVCDGF